MALDCRLRVIEGQNTLESGADAVTELLTSPDLPTAILCSNDLTAVGAIHTLTRSGLRVPDDISVLGADDIPLSRLITPPLTTIRIPRDELGREAFRMIQRMLAGQAPSGIEQTINSHLVVRGSTGTVARSDANRATE